MRQPIAHAAAKEFTENAPTSHSNFTTLVDTLENVRSKGDPMKKSLPRTIASLCMCATLLFCASAASGAPLARSNHGATTTTTFGPWKTYRQALAAYVAARKTIAETFRAAVQTAKSTYFAALASATPAERSTARAAYELAIAQAAATRSSALVSLGNPPVRPS